MHRSYLWCGLALLLCTASLAAEPPARVVRDDWDVAFVKDARAGVFHSTIREIERDGKKILVDSLSIELKIRRFNSVVEMRMENTSEETPQGKVIALSLTQFLDQGQQLKTTGRVEKGQLIVRAGPDQTQTLPWNDEVLGPVAQERQLSERKLKPGDKFDYLNFELGVLAPVKVHLTVGQEEDVDVLVASKDPKLQPALVKRKLLRIEQVSDKVIVENTPIQLPKLTIWVDKDYQTQRSEMELPGLGTITLYRTTEAVARMEGLTPAPLPDFGLNTLIPLNKTVPNIHDARAVVYRITVKGDDDPATAFAQDDRQKADKVKGETFELTVRPVREPGKDEKPAGAEYLRSNRFVTSDDDEVKALAARAVGKATDPWQKAILIEKYVHEHMTGTTAVGFTTAAQIARDLKGDCRQHALLSAAMCRAAGVPSRTALGLVYANPRDQGPVLGFHMWTEVYIGGRWLGIDATLGRGGVGPGHLKVNDHSWADAQGLAPLLPVTRVMGRLSVEVVGVE
jgi:hypothetical protein